MYQLADYAVGDSLATREFSETPHAFRNDFQRDRDRVIHSKAFRRLEYKTQVFVNHHGDHFRTRLTHSLEVSQIARTVSRALLLNEDLTEAIALAHDLGHPPFGHAGEKGLHDLMKKDGGFDHNLQTIRIVTLLEQRYPHHAGLNLTKATLLGLQKHKARPGGQSHSLEARVVDICDEIAYNCHDVEDGLDNGYLDLEELTEVKIFNRGMQHVKELYPDTRHDIQLKQAVRFLINSMVSDLVKTSQKNLKEKKIKNLDDVLNAEGKSEVVDFSPSVRPEVIQLKKFLFQKLYRHPKIVAMNKRAENIIGRIYTFIFENPDCMPTQYQQTIEKEGKHVAIADFIAGMTDRYAEKWNRMILGIETN